MNGAQLVEYFGAIRRQVAHLEALGLKALNGLGYCPPGPLDDEPRRDPSRHERGVGAIEAHVGWGRRRARSHDDLAYHTVEVFPSTWEALAEGLIDISGAHAIVDGITVMEDEQLQRRVESTILAWLRRLLEDGRQVPAYQIHVRVEREVAAVDAEGAERRHRERVRHRGLELRTSVDSVADLLLHDVPADEAAEIFAHIDAIARTHKRAGDERTLGQLRADAAANLLAGRATLVECDGGEDCPHTRCGCDCRTCADQAEGHTPTGCTDPDCPCGCTTGAGTTRTRPDRDGTERNDHTDDSADVTDVVDSESAGTDHPSGTGDDGATDATDDVDVPLGEPAGHSGHEGAAGTGTAGASDATSDRSRRCAGHQARSPANGPPRVKAKNVLHVPLTTLLGLYEQGRRDPAMLGGYGPVITEVAERVLAHHLENPDADYTVVVTHPQTGKPIQIHPVNARLFTGRLRDLIDVRWQTCTWVTKCARPAPRCVGDHSREYAKGGETSEENANPICTPHDREKTVHEWNQERPDRDTIDWRSPYGHSYRVRPDPYTEPDNTEIGDDPPPF